MPNRDWETGRLVYAADAPLLLSGDRAILFLERAADHDEWFIQSFTGMYRIERGVVQPLDGNPFRGEVDEMRVETFVRRIQGLAGS